MFKKFMWSYFEKTGDVSAFLNYKQYTDFENSKATTDVKKSI